MLENFTIITSSKVKFKWTKIEQYAFDKIKRIVARNNLLAYLDCDKKFKIYSYARKLKLGVVIIQKGKPIVLYIKKLTDSQKRCTLIEKEPIRIVGNLKGFRAILLGQILRIYIDNKTSHVFFKILIEC